MREPPASSSEIQRLLGVAERELGDAAIEGLSSDGSFQHAYTAALALATAAIRAEGLRIHGADHHRLSFDALGQIAAGRWQRLANYLQHCRGRRNRAVYDLAGVASAAEAEELRGQVTGFKDELERWLDREHPDLS